jgi:type II secretory pathway pseudopilin PulG
MTHASLLTWSQIVVAVALVINLYLMTTQVIAIRALRRAARHYIAFLEQMARDSARPP